MVEAEVATPLYNELKPIWGELMTSGVPADGQGGTAGIQGYGLVGEVVVKPFVEVVVT